MKANLNEKEFVIALERLYHGLTQVEKHCILGDYNRRRNLKDRELTFKP
jgi:hypothetical protein